MKIKRRDFLKTMAGSAAMAALPRGVSQAAEDHGRPDSHLGMLYDSTLCIGCQVCMDACKKANGMPGVQSGPLKLWENPKDLSSDTLNIIKKYKSGKGVNKDRVEDGFAFIKRQCMHCEEPACASACPASAMEKDPDTGIVTYDEGACIGCRYCQVACQFNIPKFQWEEPFPKIVKCQMCDHLIPAGGIPACCNHCPTGASLFGPVNALLEEVKRRKAITPGTETNYPIATLNSGKSAMHPAPAYIDHVYGENEIGGTQVLYLSGIPFDLLGLPELPETSYASLAENIQHTLYKGMLAPLALLGGLLWVVSRNKNHDDETDETKE